MRIDKIEFCNLGSYTGVHTLDFAQEPLRSAGLFAVTGFRGTGEAIFMEAVCLALYGKRPSFSEDKKESDSLSFVDGGDMLREGHTEGYSTLCFSLTDGSAYEVSWNVSLDKKAQVSFSHTLRKISPQREKMTYSEEQIEALTHTSCLQFLHSAFLAQRTFAHFLRAGQDCKTALFDSLTDTALYKRISSAIYDKTTNADREYKELLKVLEGIRTNCLDDSALSKLNENLILHRAQLTRDDTTLKSIEEHLQWYADYDKARQDLEEQKKLQFDALHTCSSLFDKKRTLERFDSVQPFRSLYDAIRQSEAEVSQLKDLSTLKQKELHELSQTLATRTRQNDIAQSRLTESRDVYEHQMLHFYTGHSLKGKIDAIQAELKNKAETLERCRETVRSQSEDSEGKKSALDTLASQTALLQQHLQAVVMHRTLFDNFDKVMVKFQNVRDLETIALKQQKTLQQSQESLKALKEQEAKQSKQRDQLKLELLSMRDELHVHEQANKGLNAANLQQRLTNLSDLHRRSRIALNLWKRIANDYRTIDKKESEIRLREINVATIKNNITTLSIKLSSAYEGCNVLRVSHMLSQSDNIKDIRRELKEGGACPVCGATHHPYHGQEEQDYSRPLTDLEKNYQMAEHEVISTREQLAQKREQLAEERGQMQMERKELAAMQSALHEDLDEWKDIQDIDPSLKDDSATVNDQGRVTLLLQIFDNTERDLKQQKLINDSFNKHQDVINDINRRIHVTTGLLQDILRNVSDTFIERSIAEADIANTQKQLGQNDRDSTGLVNEIDKLMTVSLWKEKWEKSHDSFLQKLTNMYEAWNADTAALSQSNQKMFQLQKEIDALDALTSDKSKQSDEIEQDIHDMQQSVVTMQQQLHNIFGDIPLERLQVQYHDALAKALQEAGDARALMDETAQKVHLLQGRLQNIESQRQLHEDVLQKDQSSLDILISRFNNDNSPLQYFELDKLFADGQDWGKLRTVIEESDRHLLEVNFHVDELSARILQLQQSDVRPSEKSDETKQALERRRFTIRQHYDTLKHQIIDSELRLAMHNAAEQQIATYDEQVKQLEQNLAHWNKLKDSLCGADGHSFRMAARQILFQKIVANANRHLASLSPRFSLHTLSGTFQLEILDRDMLSLPCSVESLSGGEYFLITLSLAFGLSSFLSDVGEGCNYFINGDFDNISCHDADLVVSALQTLQSSKKCKIVLVTHNEDILNRIPLHVHPMA